jgi:hypothetical protein
MVALGIPGELKLLLVLNEGDGSSPISVRGFLFGYKAGGLYVVAEKNGSRGPDWKRSSCVGGVSGGDVMVPFSTYNKLISTKTRCVDMACLTVFNGGNDGFW